MLGRYGSNMGLCGGVGVGARNTQSDLSVQEVSYESCKCYLRPYYSNYYQTSTLMHRGTLRVPCEISGMGNKVNK